MRLGAREWNEGCPVLLFNEGLKTFELEGPPNVDISHNIPELNFTGPAIQKAESAVVQGIGEVVKLTSDSKTWGGSELELGFKETDDAVQFVALLRTCNLKLRLDDIWM
jgi:hypothetical protein